MPDPAMRGIRVRRAKYPQARPWPLGSFTLFRTADRFKWPRISLNRYPGEVIGVAFTFRRHSLSWVWPLRVTGLRLTREQFERHLRLLIDEETHKDA